MSDVSAVVLSVREPYVQRAIDSLAAQTIPLHAVIVVENVSPFFRALNEGARQVTTPFFVQVDADMILDPSCVEVLLGEMRNDTGMVVGELRDALMGQTVGVKLFRTECFRLAAVPDSISPDTDFGASLHRQGWRTLYIRRPGDAPSAPPPTLGEHRPDYTPSYTYRKLLLEGARLRYRAAPHGLFWRMGRLEESAHPLAVLAQVALGHGFFVPLDRDELKPPVDDPRAEELLAFLGREGRSTAGPPGLRPLDRHERLGAVFERFLAAGRVLAEAGNGAAFREIFAGLSGTRRDAHPLVAKVALGHGLMMDEADRERLTSDERAFARFIVLGLGSRSGPWDHLRARVAYLTRRWRRQPSSVRW